MEVVTIESSSFRMLVEQVEMVAEYVRKSVEREKAKTPDTRIVDTAEAARLLNVSTRTMQRLRDGNRIKYMMVRGHCRYRIADLKRYMEEAMIDTSDTFQSIAHNYSLRTGNGKRKQGG